MTNARDDVYLGALVTAEHVALDALDKAPTLVRVDPSFTLTGFPSTVGVWVFGILCLSGPPTTPLNGTVTLRCLRKNGSEASTNATIGYGFSGDRIRSYFLQEVAITADSPGIYTLKVFSGDKELGRLPVSVHLGLNTN